MNDKIIINIILKTHFAIVSFLSFIFLALCILFVLLQNGINIEYISTHNIKIKALYIKWNEKLHIDIEEINILDISQSDKPLEYKKIENYINKISLFDHWLESINIKNIIFNEVKVQFKYKAGNGGFIKASSPNFSFESDLKFKSKQLLIYINKLSHFSSKTSIIGDIVLDTNLMQITSALNFLIDDKINFTLFTHANNKNLLYKIKSTQNIKNISPIVDIFNLNPSIRYWIIDAIDMSSVTINSAYGWIDYNNLDNAYKNIYVNATVNDLHYTYDKKLDAIHTDHTDLVFKDGILYIYPKEAYSYGFYLDKSWLKIDFSDKEVSLTLKLLFDAQLNNDMLYLLNRYNIDLPFTQNSGTVTTKLNLVIALRRLDIDAKGSFKIKKGNFNYLGVDLDVYDSIISLNNQKIYTNNMLVKYSNIATSILNLKLNTKKNTGKVKLKLNTINLTEQKLSLKKPLNLTYNISPIEDTIEIDDSYWNLHGDDVNVSSSIIPFSYESLQAKFPSTHIDINNLASGNISGDLSLKQEHYNLDIDLHKFTYKNIDLLQKNSAINLDIKNNIYTIQSKEKIKFMFNNSIHTLDKSIIELNNKILDIKYSGIAIDNTFSTLFNGKYNLKNKNGYLNLLNLKLYNDDLGDIFTSKNSIKLDIRSNDKDYLISSNKLDSQLIVSDKYWKLKLNALSKLSNDSSLLQDYLLNNGSFSVYKTFDDNKIKFTAKILYPHSLLLVNNNQINNYKIQGVFHTKTKTTNLNINNKIELKIDDKIDIKMRNIGINLQEIRVLLKNLKSKEQKQNKKIVLSADNSYIFLNKDRNIISDKIKLEYFNKLLTVSLIHKLGSANFVLDGDNYYLYGENFNDKFMQNLLSESKFIGGDMNFSLTGKSNQFKGFLHLNNTTILKFNVINNVLAFVNTIPSLVTFSLPSYNKNGLAVDSAYMNFDTQDTIIFNIKDLLIDSKEMKIIGRGEANIDKNNLNMQLNLKTDLGSAVSKIPVVGYIFLGNDTVSTSLKVTGELNNPKVKTQVAKDIVVAPLNIIKRTLLLPSHLLNNKK